MIKIFVALIIFSLTGCKSIPVNPRLAKEREQLLKEEQWRHQLPLEEKAVVAPVFPTVKKAKLKNGLSIYVVEDHRLPIAEVNLVFKNGSARDPIGQFGLQNLVSLMLKEGTKKLSSLGLAEAFAQLGTQVSVGVGKDFSQISVGILSDKMKETVKLLASMAQNPRMEQSDFDRVKFQQLNFITASQAMPNYVAQVSFLNTAYGKNHPYAHPSKGTIDSLNQITLDQVKQAYTQNFGPDNAALIVVGDADLASIKKMAKKNFSKWKKINYRTLEIAAPAAHKEMTTNLIARPHTPQTYLLVGKPVATMKDQDLPSYSLLQQILASIPSSRLDSNLREKKGWTYGVASSVNPFQGLGPFFVTTSIRVPFGADALGEILKEFEMLNTTPVSDEELKAAKVSQLDSFASRYSTVQKISDIVSEQFLYDLPTDYDEKYYEKIKAVTKEDIMTVAKKAFNKEQLTAVAVGELEVMQVPLANMKVGKVIVEGEQEHSSN